MATGPKQGLVPSRTLGSGPDTKGLEEYPIANQYAVNLFIGDPVQLTSSGTIVRAVAGEPTIGVFRGCVYTNTEGQPIDAKYWPASTNSATQPVARILADARATFTGKANGSVARLVPGDVLGFDFGAGDTTLGRSTGTLIVLAQATGTLDIEGETDLGANTAISDTDAFTVRSLNGSSSPVTITIADGDGAAELLVKINAVDNITGTITSSGYLKIEATDGYDLELLESTGTPLADLGLNVGIVRAKAGLTTAIGDVDLSNQADIGANVAGVADADAFTIRTSKVGQATTITITDGDGGAELLNKLNAVTGIAADLDASGFLRITAIDNGDLILAESTNTPLAGLGFTAGTYKAENGLVVVRKVNDTTELSVEVSLANHEYRGNVAN